MIITFYSFKGGVGRSMALANVANWLRLQNLRVAVLDWDLEAPGLENFFVQSPARRAEVRAAVGLIDLLVSYKERHAQLPPEFFAETSSAPAASATPQPPKPPPLADRVAILRRTLPTLASLMIEIVPERQIAPGGGKLSLLAPGMRDEGRKYAYARDVQAFNWGELYAKYDGEVLFAWMRDELERDFDVTLIDSRTGITEVGGVCTREMADVVVTLCAANDQNLEGSALVVRSLFREELVSLRGGRRIRAALVPARYDNGETAALLAFQKRFASTARDLSALEKNEAWRGLDPEAMWELRLPYTPKYAYQERLCVGADDANPDLLLRYEKLAQFVASVFLESVPAEARAKLEAAGRDLQKLASAETPSDTLEVVLEKALAELSEDARKAAESVLLRFVAFSDPLDPTSVTLRSRSFEDFAETQRGLLQEFVKVRLLAPAATRPPGSATPLSLTTRLRIPYNDAQTKWGRLKAWVAADLEFLLFRDTLTEKAALRAAGQPVTVSTKFRAAAEDFAERRDELSETERTFLDWLLASPKSTLRRTAAVVGAAATVLVGTLWLLAKPLGVNPIDTPPRPTSSIPERTPEQIADEFISSARGLELDSQLDAAQRAYSSAIEKNPKAKDAFLGRGALLLKQQRFDLAEQDFNAAVALDTEDPVLNLQLGQALARQGKHPAAIESFSRSIALVAKDPKSDRKSSATAYAELGDALRVTGKLEDAVAAYKEAVSRRDDYWDALYGRALAYLQLQQKDLAADDLQIVATRCNEPGLRDSAVARLKDLGIKQPQVVASANEVRRVSVQYASSADKPTIDKLIAALTTKQRSLPGAERTAPRTTGDVRSFFAADRPAAAALRQDAERALANLGYQLKLSQLDLDSKAFPRATAGVIELWLPALEQYKKTMQPSQRCYAKTGEDTIRFDAPTCKGVEMSEIPLGEAYRGGWAAEGFLKGRCSTLIVYRCP